MSEIVLPTYKDRYTLDGKLRPQMGVSREKVKAVSELLNKAMNGDIIADAHLREAVSSSDAIVNIAHAVNMEFIPQLPKVTHDLDTIAGTRVVPDFRPTVLYSIFLNNGTLNYNESDLNGPGKGQHGGALVVPEGANYPIVSLAGGIESYYSHLAKRGAQFDFTWEARINDAIGFFENLPQELLALTGDSEYHELFDALLQATSASTVAGTDAVITSQGRAMPMPNGITVPANPTLSPYAVFRAQQEVAWRTINGRLIGSISRWNLIVPIGQKQYWDFQVAQRLLQYNTSAGSADLWYSGAEWNTFVGNVNVIESERVTGSNWYLVPAPGATARPVLERLHLRGYESPELRVQNLQGTYAGGGNIAPFEGSFASDSISFRYRYVTGGVLWSEAWIVWSDGSGGGVTFPETVVS